MGMLSALQRLAADHVAAIRVADAIQKGLSRASTKRDLEMLAFDAIDLNDRVLRPHIRMEAETLLAVAKEHLPPEELAVVDRAERTMDTLQDCLDVARLSVEGGEPLRPILERIEYALRVFVEQEQAVLLPWARETLGPTLMEEIERRFDPAGAASDDALRAMANID